MTRVYENAIAAPGLRVLVVGAGAYPFATSADEDVPKLGPLTSVPPGVMAFLRRLLTDWRDSFAAPLFSVDLLLSDPSLPGGAVWPGVGAPGEAAPGAALDPPTLTNVEAALDAALKDAGGDDALLLLFCGHGFSRGRRYFVLSDFGEAPGNPWSRVVDLDDLALGLRQKPPRQQWLFWDCCADIPVEVLDVLGDIGDSLIQPRGSAVAAAVKKFGPLYRSGVASSPIGVEADGVAGQPSRFVEMLIEAIDGAGATRRQNGLWWVDDRGVLDAIQTYARRHPELLEPEFYSFVTPSTTDAPKRIPLRRLDLEPTSHLVASSVPRGALKAAHIDIARDGAAAGVFAFSQKPPGATAVIHIPLPPLHTYVVTARFNGGEILSRLTFADLPLAEDVEFQAP